MPFRTQDKIMFPELTKQSRKKLITDCVREFVKKYPIEYFAIVENVKRIRATRKDPKFNTFDKDSAYIRWTLRIPTKLFQMIDDKLHSPRFLEQDWEIEWFKKEFPEFKVSQY